MSTFKKGKGERGDGGKLIIAAGYWCGRNATILGELTLGYATSKGDNEHGEICEWVNCVVLFGEWNKCVLDASARWGIPTRAGKDWGTSLQTALRGQLLKMGSQYRECVNDEGTPSVLIKGPPESRRGIDEGNDDVDGEGERARRMGKNVDSLRYVDVWLYVVAQKREKGARNDEYSADEVTETMGESPEHVSSRVVDFHPGIQFGKQNIIRPIAVHRSAVGLLLHAGSER
ncbi:hypothetical protein EDB89DRAFT_1904771 [Lactarius sanguifluus]|nr:hypothetical protein EDB89DRAFT_1912238 [Lactarius sanguifluus]KAH9174046.1 hypothetical protein EDB89DRAFT_1904771 [Lactarius sanguifluus]